MQGLMMDYPLTLQHAFNRAVRLFARKEIVTQTDGEAHRYTYRDWGKRTIQLANALRRAGVAEGEHRHVRLEHIPSLRAVFCHSLHGSRSAYPEHSSFCRSASLYYQ